mmetsp:Transcript_7729/g.15901  ORF Transcript_7729/g.15901 Transcript_7729/m.15901 type:complete len:199 (+) Transcript_7729:457-1053(+)
MRGTRPRPPDEDVEIRRGVFSATTPPQIKATNTTLAKGVKREMRFANLGARALTNMPNSTGIKTTRAVAVHKVHPEMAMVLPTRSFTKSGVATEAKTVEQDVSSTERATSALAMSETKLEAVPPGEHPTRHNPRNKALPCSADELSSKVRPTVNDVMGIMRNWHSTPTGTDARSFFSTTVKSSFVSVNPVPHMTKANM